MILPSPLDQAPPPPPPLGGFRCRHPLVLTQDVSKLDNFIAQGGRGISAATHKAPIATTIPPKSEAGIFSASRGSDAAADDGGGVRGSAPSAVSDIGGARGLKRMLRSAKRAAKAAAAAEQVAAGAAATTAGAGRRKLQVGLWPCAKSYEGSSAVAHEIHVVVGADFKRLLAGPDSSTRCVWEG